MHLKLLQVVRDFLQEDVTLLTTLYVLNPHQICDLLELCLNTTYSISFTMADSVCNGCAIWDHLLAPLLIGSWNIVLNMNPLDLTLVLPLHIGT